MREGRRLLLGRMLVRGSHGPLPCRAVVGHACWRLADGPALWSRGSIGCHTWQHPPGSGLGPRLSLGSEVNYPSSTPSLATNASACTPVFVGFGLVWANIYNPFASPSPSTPPPHLQQLPHEQVGQPALVLARPHEHVGLGHTPSSSQRQRGGQLRRRLRQHTCGLGACVYVCVSGRLACPSPRNLVPMVEEWSPNSVRVRVRDGNKDK